MATPQVKKIVENEEATGPKFKVKKTLTPALLKFVEEETRYVKITGEIYLGKEQAAKDGDKKKDPAHLAPVINLETGEECVIIIGAVVASVLKESYPGTDYVGKSFAITKKARQPGKQYNPYQVDELE